MAPLDSYRQLLRRGCRGRLRVALAPAPGSSVLHIGCGTGYYTALLEVMEETRVEVAVVAAALG
jgi:protein-L-isoaspartate O-methyltransferase